MIYWLQQKKTIINTLKHARSQSAKSDLKITRQDRVKIRFKAFLLKIIKLSILCYALLWLLQFAIDYGLKSSNDEMYYDWNKIYKGEINTVL